MALAGLFLIAHGLLHIAVWLPRPKADAPFDPQASWLIADARGTARTLAVAACAVLVVAGILVVAGGGAGRYLAMAGAVLSLVLVLLTFNRWLIGAVAIDIAIIALALS